MTRTLTLASMMLAACGGQTVSDGGVDGPNDSTMAPDFGTTGCGMFNTQMFVVDAPRALVSTPVHLRALLDASVPLPLLDLVLCATATLSERLAREVEARCGAPLLEIYGSTETGQIASRRTARERPGIPEVRLQVSADRCWAQGGHVQSPTPLADVLEPLDEAHFILHGRSADLVNVAGKRSSLAHLSQQLLAIPGVVDGAFFVRDSARGSVDVYASGGRGGGSDPAGQW